MNNIWYNQTYIKCIEIILNNISIGKKYRNTIYRSGDGNYCLCVTIVHCLTCRLHRKSKSNLSMSYKQQYLVYIYHNGACVCFPCLMSFNFCYIPTVHVTPSTHGVRGRHTLLTGRTTLTVRYTNLQ